LKKRVILCIFTLILSNFDRLYIKSMYHRYILFSYLFLLSVFTFSQNETKKWYFGAGAGLDFNTNPPTILNNGSLYNMYGCASISDTFGNLLFYTDGETVWNKSHSVMSNGAGLNAGLFASQSSIIIQQPGNSSIYYLFTPGNEFGVRYSTIDMSQDSGMGAVTVQNTPVSSSWYPQKICATRHCNGTDVWVLVRDGGWDGGGINNPINFQAFLVTSTGVNTTPVISPANNWNTSGGWYSPDVGCMKISANGKKLGLAIYNIWGSDKNNVPTFELYDFDASTGVVSNSLALNSTNQLNNAGYGCEFSLDGSKFYGSSPYTSEDVNNPNIGNIGILQWDLCAGSNNDIFASQYTVAANLDPNDLFGSMQLAADGKIYIAKKNQTVLDVINFPDLAGAASNYVTGGQSISPNTCGEGLPNFMSSYFLPLAPPRVVPPFNYNANYTTSCLTASFNAQALAVPCSASGYSVSNISWLFGDTASGAANTSALYNPSHTYPRPDTYTVQLIYNYVCGSDTLIQPIVIGGPSLTVVASEVSCAQLGTATVSANGGIGAYSFTWNPGAQTSPFATGLSPGTYSITLFDNGNGCTIAETVTIVSSVSFSGVISSTSVNCNGGSSGSASITLSNGSSAASNYFWTNGTTAITNSIATNLTAGVYTVTVIDGLTSCSFTQSFFISQPPPLNVNVASATSTVCIGGIASFTATSSGGTPGYTYNWMGSSLTNTHAVTLNLEGAYVYSVNSIDANNCSITQTVSVWVPKAASLIAKPQVCLNASINLQGFGADVYEWTGPNNFSAKSRNVNFNASNIAYAGVYTLTATDAFGCITKTTTAIVINDLPRAIIVSSGANGCVPYCANYSLKNISNSTITNYSWQINNQTDTASNFKYCVTQPGSYELVCTFTSAISCSNTASYKIEGYPSPAAHFDYSPQKPIAGMDKVLFTDNSVDKQLNRWSWFFINNNGYKANTQNTSYVFDNAGTYPVALVVSNSWGCVDTVVKTIRVDDDFNVFVPNTFTPNEDGNNDTFQPKLTGVTKYRLTIYSRWGQKIFETTNVLESWDGTFKGEGCKSEVYVWNIDATGLNSKAKNMNGFVMLYR
jgi:gliding motility-associated-like protein